MFTIYTTGFHIEKTYFHGHCPETSNLLKIHVGYEVLTALVMNDDFFWDIAPCSPHVN
jgi:hypothetical protein